MDSPPHISSPRSHSVFQEENHSVLTQLLTGTVLLSILQRALRCRGDRSARITGWDPNPCGRGPVHGRAASGPWIPRVFWQQPARAPLPLCPWEGLRPTFLQERLHIACISDKSSAPEGTRKSCPPRPQRLLSCYGLCSSPPPHAWLTPPSSHPRSQVQVRAHERLGGPPCSGSWTHKELK